MNPNYKQILIFTLLLSIIISSSWIPIPTCFSQDPLGSKLKVEGDIEIEAGGLRLKPVVGSQPANPEVGDLYFDGSTLYTWDGDIWQTFAAADKGNIFYNNTDNTLYFYDGETWEQLGAGGGAGEGLKAVATKIVAASNTPDADTRADYVCTGSADQQDRNCRGKQKDKKHPSHYIIPRSHDSLYFPVGRKNRRAWLRS